MYPYDLEKLKAQVIDALHEKGVEIKDIAQIVYDMQRPYHEDMTMEIAEKNVLAVLSKREVIHAMLTGMALDDMAQHGLMPEPIQTIIREDEGLYGIDEVLALAIVNIYGTIGLTNFGFLDKEKVGIIRELDTQRNGMVTTFLDDLVAAVAASAISRIVHAD